MRFVLPTTLLAFSPLSYAATSDCGDLQVSYGDDNKSVVAESKKK